MFEHVSKMCLLRSCIRMQLETKNKKISTEEDGTIYCILGIDMLLLTYKWLLSIDIYRCSSICYWTITNVIYRHCILVMFISFPDQVTHGFSPWDAAQVWLRSNGFRSPSKGGAFISGIWWTFGPADREPCCELLGLLGCWLNATYILRNQMSKYD